MKSKGLKEIRIIGSETGIEKLHEQIRRPQRWRRETLQVGWELSAMRTVQSKPNSRRRRVTDQHLGPLERITTGAQERLLDWRSEIVGRHVVTVRPHAHVRVVAGPAGVSQEVISPIRACRIAG